MMRPCLSCGALVRSPARRCPPHARAWEAQRTAGRGTLYGKAHQRKARATIEGQPWCGACGSTVDLVADHVVPGDPDSPLRTLCRSCNSTRANRGRWGGRSTT